MKPPPPPAATDLSPASDKPPRRRRRLARLGCTALLATTALLAQADLPAVIAAARPSVVAIGTYNALDSPRFTFRGTGFAVGDGRQIVTNRHVLPGAEQVGSDARLAVAVPIAAGVEPEIREATLATSSLEHDLALLTVPGRPLPALPLAADSAVARVRDGQAVVLIGFPLGTQLGMVPVSHHGIVAATVPMALPPPNSRQLDARTLNLLRQGPLEVYQLDATAYPGNSGSPLLDADSGQVLAIVNMVLVKASKEALLNSPSGISYAIPSRHIRALLK